MKMSSSFNQLRLLLICIILVSGTIIKSSDVNNFIEVNISEKNESILISDSTNIGESLNQNLVAPVIKIEDSPIATPKREYLSSNIILNDVIQQSNILDAKYLKINKLKNVLSAYGSPLVDQAELLLNTSEEYGLDYRLVSAISVVESGGGKKQCASYNAWGYGGQKCVAFNNWEEAIRTVSVSLKYWYYDKGAITPKQISRTYNADMPDLWAKRVQAVMDEMK
jgi:hypothetical protein